MGNFVRLVPLALGAAAVGRILRRRGFSVRAAATTPPVAPVVGREELQVSDPLEGDTGALS